ncbi:MAG: hypothetical protein ABII64_01205 [Elusimicrobiota bacterium]
MSESKSASEKDVQQAKSGRYDYYNLTKEWAEILKRSDAGKGLTMDQLISKATEDIASGLVTPEEVMEKRSKLNPVKPEEVKPESLESPKKDEKENK